MHLMLRVSATGTEPATALVATVEATHTVDELRRALVARPGVAVEPRSCAPAPARCSTPGATRRDRVGLRGGPGAHRAGAGFVAPHLDAAVRIEAVGGPASGWRSELPRARTRSAAQRAAPSWTPATARSPTPPSPAPTSRSPSPTTSRHPPLAPGGDQPPTGRRRAARRPGGGRRVQRGPPGRPMLVRRPVEARPTARIDQRPGRLPSHPPAARPTRGGGRIPIPKVPTRGSAPVLLALLSRAPAGRYPHGRRIQEPRFLIFVFLAPSPPRPPTSRTASAAVSAKGVSGRLREAAGRAGRGARRRQRRRGDCPSRGCPRPRRPAPTGRAARPHPLVPRAGHPRVPGPAGGHRPGRAPHRRRLQDRW